MNLKQKAVRLAFTNSELREPILRILSKVAQKAGNLSEEIPLAPEDEALLDEVWDDMAMKWWQEDFDKGRTPVPPHTQSWE